MSRKRPALTRSYRVFNETREALDETNQKLNLTPTELFMAAYATYAGEVETKHGKLSDVLAREMRR